MEIIQPGSENTPFVQLQRIEATLIAKLNLADFQNAIPMFCELTIINDALDEIRNLELRVESVPAFLKPKTWRLDAIGPNQRYRIPNPDVQLDGALLTRLVEAESATVSITLLSCGVTVEELARIDRTVELLPRNQWGGISHLPDMIAAFVQPNEPAIERVLKKAAEILRKNDMNPSLDGYSGGSKRVWELVSGIWSAVAGMGLDYALPPASFEYAGQKIRSSAQIVESGLATCLDLTLLFCSAIEQAGLNPLVVFTKGHAIAGVWLKPEDFSTTTVDDVTALRKRIKLQELIVFETTVITQRPAPNLSYAAKLGAQHISEEKEDSFEMAVDIRRARLQRIKPLASSEVHLVPGPPVEPPSTPELPIENNFDLQDDEIIVEPDPAILNPKDRLDRWQRKLLDLSLRNNLLNFKGAKKALKLEAPKPGALEDLLADGHSLKLLPRPALMDKIDPRNQALYEDREREDLRRGHALDALNRHEVFIDISQTELETRLVDLYRKSRLNLQEGGANTLFLAIGFLSWKREDREGQRYRAPLILLPVTLNRKSVRSGFTLTLHDDEPRFNPTLIEMLRQDFKLNLSITDGELPKDDAGLDVTYIWRSVSHAIKDIQGWEVTEDVVLATFSFAKYLMWKDLMERTDQLRKNPVVRHLIDTPRESYPAGVAFPNPKRLDFEFTPEQTFCPLPADSSQLSAVMAASKGKDFVLIGPPGTGKSQTISNLIVQCLAEGKRVLFVSEKIAALDVVYRRLREIGLDEFCLELHSNKARKLDVITQLQQAWSARGENDPEAWHVEALRLKKLRDQLNVYVERLHCKRPNGMTIYKAIGCVIAGSDIPDLRLSWNSANTHSVLAMQQIREIVGRLEVNAKAVGQDALLGGSLAAVRHADWSPNWQQTLVDAARRVSSTAQTVEQIYEQFVQTTGLPRTPLNYRARKAIAMLAKLLPYAAGRNLQFVLRPDAKLIAQRLQEGAKLLAKQRELSAGLSPQWPETIVSGCQRGLDLLKKRREIFESLGQPWTVTDIELLKKGLHLIDEIEKLKKQISVQYNDGIEQLNLHQLHREWNKAENAIWPMSWLGKHKVRKALNTHVMGEGKAEIGRDVGLLSQIKSLCSEISALTVAPEVECVWHGLNTQPEFVNCSVIFQDVLTAAKNSQKWEEGDFELIANGRCGEALRMELNKLQMLKILDADLESLESLGASTMGLWAGLATQTKQLEAALRFQAALQDFREAGTPPGDHSAVSQGECGAAFLNDFQCLCLRADIEKQIAGYENLREITAGLWDGLNTPHKKVEDALKFLNYLASAVADLSSTPDQIKNFKSSLQYLFADGNELLKPGGPISSICNKYIKALDTLQLEIESLVTAGSFTEESKLNCQDLLPYNLSERCMAIVRSEGQLHAWCAWRKVCGEAEALGLAPLVNGIENGSLSQFSLPRVFETTYSRWWLNAVVEEEPVIRGFVSVEHEKHIDDFRTLDEQFINLTRAWVRARLCAELPTQDSVTKNSEWGILRHEMNKKKRHMPLRELMSRIPLALPKLTPCLLMSPLSIAQYLATDTNTFDLVVFDEASQIPVWDAVGAIARGKQVVMVGDPKQLPPTSFFDRAESDLDDEDVEGDLESILDECMGANLPTMNLAWHYRSRHESLIAFSNHNYYGGSLVTFPSPVIEDRAVSFHYVNGVYEKGGARINKLEARALVADLVNKLKSQNVRESGLTIGVVTFNSEQQALIEDMLDDERRKDPSLEPYFAEIELEPVFVKNLESVQGDERDIIYFSITYGPDLSGAVSMNFGPMNRDGGERRLNVAITRARHELRVFSSLKAEQINLARTQALGVRDLKRFLEFAERGPRALAEAISGSRGDFESPFEEAVAAALTRKGWELQSQVGVSAFRVDLAVVHPDAPGAYLTGIECDGATYHRSATARDRDKLREQVLRGLGWEILRVWSTDWWINPQGTLAKLDAALQILLETSRTKRIAETEGKADCLAPEETEAEVRVEMNSYDEQEGSRLDSTLCTQKEIGTKLEPVNIRYTTGQPMAGTHASNLTLSPIAQPTVFVEADPASVVDKTTPEAFFEVSYEFVLTKMIAHVVEIEGPVLDLVLARRIARAHGWQRTGARIQKCVDSLAVKVHATTKEDIGAFYWAKNRGPEMPISFRRAIDTSARIVDEICMPELVALAREVIKRGKVGEDAILVMARELGLQRLRETSRGRIEKAMLQVRNP